jgi:hypothetical protein
MIADKLTQENPKHVLKFVRLSDGRRLAYSEYGVPDGKLVLYCHGHPGSRLDPGMNAFLITLAEFLRQGSHSPALEASLYMRPWGFPLDEIKTPTNLWHGQADQNAPVAMGRDLSERIPNCQAKFAPDEGHFSLIINSAPEVFGFLVEE